jgi:hypothetical protein
MKSTGQIHTLFACSDGETPFFFADPKFLYFGVTNVGDSIKSKELDLKLQPVGLKFFSPNLETSNHIF